jgi:hypothetical protein
MKKLSISPELEEKIYDLKIEGDDGLSQIATYFPLNSEEKQEILKEMDQTKKPPVEFKSIFSDEISQQEWLNSKEQIKKRFRDELIKID